MNIQSGTATTTLAPANPWALVPPLGNLDAYISAVNRLPLLTHEEEQTYARQLRDNNDVDAAGRVSHRVVEIDRGGLVEKSLGQVHLAQSGRDHGVYGWAE